MPDPISIFPEFVRNQVFPPTATSGEPIVVEVATTTITATVADPGAITISVTPTTIIAGS